MVDSWPTFDGKTYRADLDGERLQDQLTRVRSFMLGRGWVSSTRISQATECNWSSASARLRDLRKDKFGGFVVERRRLFGGSGLHEYRVLEPPPTKQGDLF